MLVLKFAFWGLLFYTSIALGSGRGITLESDESNENSPGLAPPMDPEPGSGEITPDASDEQPILKSIENQDTNGNSVSRRSVESTVSFANQKIIVEEHNKYRSVVDPPARNMRQMYWNKDLANAAQKVADECRTGNKHDDAWDRTQLAKLGIAVGQNYALGPNGTLWKDVVAAWYNEVDDFNFGEASTDGKPVGHYTQEVLAKSNLVGCGATKCPIGEYFYCNYAYPNMNYRTPYVNGTSCAECPNTCTANNLCDCGTKLCAHGGELDLQTCKCTCHHGFSGDECTVCPFVDMDYNCGTNWKSSACSQYTNVPEACPIMCGVCNATCPEMNYNSCKNGGTPTSDCKCDCLQGYGGDDCACDLSLPKDPDYCDGELPYQYPYNYCIYTDVKAACPRMCGCKKVDETTQ